MLVDPREAPRSASLLLAGLALLVVAAVLPWFTVEGSAVTGLENSDGWVSIGIAVAALALAVGLEWDLFARIGATITGIFALYMVIATYTQIDHMASHEWAWGLVLTGIGGVAVLVAAVWGTYEEWQELGQPRAESARVEEGNGKVP